MFVKLVFATASAVALCCAQSDPTPPAGSTPVAKVTSPDTAGPPAPPPSGGVLNPPPAEPEPATPALSAAPKPGPQVLESQPAASSAPSKAPDAEKGENSAAINHSAADKDPYIIGPLDVIVVKVWNNQPLSGVYDVHQDGSLSMPLIGDLKAEGLTRGQLRDVIAKKLGDCCLVTPEVSVEVGKINSKRYYVYGDVGRTGPFPLIQATTVMDALSEVGGFRDFANVKKIRILRELPGGKKAQEFRFNYKEVSHGRHLEQNIQLQNGDRIFVGE